MELRFYKQQDLALIEQYQLREEQLRYTAMPGECIELSKTDVHRLPVLAIEDERLVTFFVLDKGKGPKAYTSNKDTILIRAFSTDYRYQGFGYAKKALSLLPAFVCSHFQDIKEIILAVNVKNTIAQGLYKKCGYMDHGERRMGKKGELIIMSYPLSVS